jgi:hypothetical protein
LRITGFPRIFRDRTSGNRLFIPDWCRDVQLEAGN